MKITMVIDLYGDKNNGTTVTAMRTLENLQRLGHEVKVIAWLPPFVKEEDLNGVTVMRCQSVHVPVFQKLVESQGFMFAKAKEKDIAEFIKDSDVVHIMLPFPLEAKVMRIAKVMGIPVTGGYHLQPENITYTIGMGKWKLVNSFVYHLFYKWVYRYIRTIHTPSKTMQQEMLDHHYHGDIHAISNGVSSFMHPIKVEKPEIYKDKYVIVMVGRLSGEKRQDLLIKAIGHSKYNDKIQLILCGKGPKKLYYSLLAKQMLANPLQIQFVTQEKLREILNWTDLYVHSSDVESEAIACIEAFSCGAVPVISDSPYTATRHFSLDEHCLFKAGNYKSLQSRIEFFISHDDFKRTLSPLYVEYSKQFSVMKKAKELSEMMEIEIRRNQQDKELGRVYYSTFAERRKLRRIAKKAGIKNPLILKKDVYHSKEKVDWKNKNEKRD